MTHYVINLDRSPGRWSFMQALCAERGLAAQRVPAVDGQALSEEQLEQVSPRVSGVRRLAASEIGCFESHKAAWRRIAEGPDSHGCVMEDDIFLARGVAGICARLLSEWPQLDLVKLNSYHKPIFIANAPFGEVGAVKLFRVHQRTIDASAYVMSRECARTALVTYASYQAPIDILLFDPASDYEIAQVVPAVAVQSKYADFQFLEGVASDSTIQETRAVQWDALREGRQAQSPAIRVRNELRRLWRRRIFPGTLALTNPFRPPERRMLRRRIGFADLE